MACSGVIGFNSGSYGLSKGDIGFMRIRLSVVGRGVGFCGGGVYVFGREKVRPARSIHPKFGIIVLAGRVFRTNRLRLSLVGDAAHFRLATMGYFAPCEALRRRVAGVSHPCMAQFPPIGGGAARVCEGVAANRSNVARNSPTTASQAELPSLELQRLRTISKSDRIKLRATFGRYP